MRYVGTVTNKLRSVRGRSGKHMNHITALGDEVHVWSDIEDGLAIALSSLNTRALTVVDNIVCSILIAFIVRKSVWAFRMFSEIVGDPVRSNTTKASYKTFTAPRRRRHRPTILSEISRCRARLANLGLSMRSATGNPPFAVSLTIVLDSFRQEPAPFTPYSGIKQRQV